MSFSIRATARYIPMSPRKARLVIDLIRGRPVPEALGILSLAPQSASRPVAKVLESAVANALDVYGLERDELYVSEARADGGPIAKRGRFAARGRWKSIKKRSCHITVGIRERESSTDEAPESEAPQQEES